MIKDGEVDNRANVSSDHLPVMFELTYKLAAKAKMNDDVNEEWMPAMETRIELPLWSSSSQG